MEKILFIINPIAGKGKAEETIPLIENMMKENHLEYKIILTTKPGDATKIASEMVDNYPIVIAVGGDGTVNEVARGLIRKKIGILGIIPSGTGNDMSKSLGISLNSKEALESIIKGKNKKMDIGLVNDNLFLNIASIGFDAEVVKNVEGIKKKVKGKASYVLGVLVTLFSFKKQEMILEMDGEVFKRNMVLLAVGNGGYYGGGMNILPMADISDGYFNICLVKNISNLNMLFLFPSIFKGKHLKYTKYVEIFKARSVIVKNKENRIINLDGELILSKEKDIIFKLDNYKLDVISNINFS